MAGVRRSWGVLVAVAALLAGSLASVGTAAAAETCLTSGPTTNAYAVTVCLSAPATGSTLAGTTTVTATATTASGTSPGVGRLIFDIDGAYVLTGFAAPTTFTLDTRRWADGPHVLGVVAKMNDGFTSARATADLTFANGGAEPPTASPFQTRQAAPAAGAPLVVAATGDGASGKPRSKTITDMVSSWSPDLFLYLGDVYDKGTATEFDNWYGDPKYFGRLRDRTNPTVGNHEYAVPNAAGYFDHWGAVPRNYSWDAGGWHFATIDSTTTFNQIAPGTAQFEWLRNDLAAAAASTPCSVVYFHHPVWSVGAYDDSVRLGALWQLLADAGVDLVLTAHDHNYQRWVPMDGAGAPASGGPTQFVVGGGGHSLYSVSRTDSRTTKVSSTSPDGYGALRLELFPGSASFGYHNVNGTRTDSGSLTCSGGGPDVMPPTTPGSFTATATSPNDVALSWQPSSDTVGIAGYQVRRDGVVIAETGRTVTTITDRPVADGRTYTYDVVARDPAGNGSEPATATVATPVAPPPSLADGFETGSLGKWVNNGMTVQSADVFAGGFAARAASAGPPTYARSTVPSASELYYRARVKVLKRDPTHSCLIKFRSATATVVDLCLDSTGVLFSWNYTTRSSIWGGPALANGRWYDIQMRAVVNGTQSRTEVWVDGKRADAISVTTNLGSAPLAQVQLGTDELNRTYDFAFDEVAVRTAWIHDEPPAPPPPDTTPPSVPVVAAALVDATSADVTWAASSDDSGVHRYDIERNGFGYRQQETPSFRDTGLQPATTYTYRVRARDIAGNASAWSAPASVTTPEPPSADTTPPSVPSVTAVLSAATTADLSWTASTDDRGVTSYTVERNGSVHATVTSTQLRDTGLSPQTTYTYRVQAADAAGNVSDWSAPASVTTPAAPPAWTAFADGFETGNLFKWNGGVSGNLVVQAGGAASGTYAARASVTSTPASALATLSSAQTEVYARLRLKVSSRGSKQTVNFLKLSAADGSPIAGFYVSNNSGKLGVRNDVTAIGTSTGSLPTGVWHDVQIHVRVAGTASTVEAWLNGTRVYARTENLGTKPVALVRLGDPSGGKSYDFSYDDVAVDTVFLT